MSKLRARAHPRVEIKKQEGRGDQHFLPAKKLAWFSCQDASYHTPDNNATDSPAFLNFVQSKNTGSFNEFNGSGNNRSIKSEQEAADSS